MRLRAAAVVRLKRALAHFGLQIGGALLTGLGLLGLVPRTLLQCVPPARLKYPLKGPTARAAAQRCTARWPVDQIRCRPRAGQTEAGPCCPE